VTDYRWHPLSLARRFGPEVFIVLFILFIVALLVVVAHGAEESCRENGGQWVTGYANGGPVALCIPRRDQ